MPFLFDCKEILKLTSNFIKSDFIWNNLNMNVSLNNGSNSNILYITGAGGTSTNAINISTLSSIVANSLGLRVIKHVSEDSIKKCSSVAFLDALGIKTARSIKEIEKYFYSTGIAFVDAMPEQIIDNLCPLLSPVAETARFIGLADVHRAMGYLFELRSKNYKRAIIACSSNPSFDEVNICGCTQIFELVDNEIKNYVINPVDFGIEEAEPISVTGATPLYNANLCRDILNKKMSGAKLDVIVMNVGVMIYIAGLVDSIKKGIILAYNAIDSFKALDKLNNLRG